MEKWDARHFPQMADPHQCSWNVVELESRKNLRSKIHELLELTNNSTLSTSDIKKRLHLYTTQFGTQFVTQLVRALQREDQDEREAIVWLLTLLNDPATIPQLQQLAHQERHSRAIRLSAALVLAGMGVTKEQMQTSESPRLYAIR